MRKKLLNTFILSALMVMPLFFAMLPETWGQVADDEYEPNNDIYHAADLGPLEINIDSVNLENLVAYNDDFYKLDLYAARNVTITLSYGSGPENLDLYFFDSEGKMLAKSTNAGTIGQANVETINYPTTTYTGIYIIGVKRISTVTDYTLSISYVPVSDLKEAEWNVWPGDEYTYSIQYTDVAYPDRLGIETAYSSAEDLTPISGAAIQNGDPAFLKDKDGKIFNVTLGANPTSHDIENKISFETNLRNFPQDKVPSYENLTIDFAFNMTNLTGMHGVEQNIYLYNFDEEEYERVDSRVITNLSMEVQSFNVSLNSLNSNASSFIDAEMSNQVRVLVNYYDPYIVEPVMDKDLDIVPGGPAVGDRYILTLTQLLYQYSVLDKDLATPPATGNVTGDRYIIPVGAGAPWNTHVGQIAEWTGTSWTYQTPVAKWTTYVQDEDMYYTWTGATWQANEWAAHKGDITEWTGAKWRYYDTCSLDEAWSAWVEDEGQYYTRSTAGTLWLAGAGSQYIEPVIEARAAPPVGVEGARYLITAGASGAWTGCENNITEYDGADWGFFTPAKGWTVWDNNTESFYTWDGTAWIDRITGRGLNSAFDQIKVNGTMVSQEKYVVSSFSSSQVDYQGIQGTRYFGQNLKSSMPFKIEYNQKLEDFSLSGFDKFFGENMLFFTHYNENGEFQDWYMDYLNRMGDENLRVALDSQNATHMVWQRQDWDGDYEIFYSNNTQGSFGTPVQITHNHCDDTLPGIAIDGNDVVHLAWQRWDGNDYEVMYHNNSFNALDGSGPVTGFENLTSFEIQLTQNEKDDKSPQIVYNPSDTKVYILWSSFIGLYPNLYMSNSTAFLTGTVLTDQILNARSKDITKDNSYNVEPVMTVSDGGIFHIAWIGGIGTKNLKYTSSEAGEWDYDKFTVWENGTFAGLSIAVPHPDPGDEVHISWAGQVGGDFEVMSINITTWADDALNIDFLPTVTAGRYIVPDFQYFDPVLNKDLVRNPATPLTDDRYLLYNMSYLDMENPIISVRSSPPGTYSLGDRYLVAPGAIGAWAGSDNRIVEWTGVWTPTFPLDNMTVYDISAGLYRTYLAGNWIANAWVGHDNQIAEWNGTTWVYEDYNTDWHWAVWVDDESDYYTWSITNGRWEQAHEFYGHDNQIANWVGSWDYLTPLSNWNMYVSAQDARYHYNGSVWSAIGNNASVQITNNDFDVVAPQIMFDMGQKFIMYASKNPSDATWEWDYDIFLNIDGVENKVYNTNDHSRYPVFNTFTNNTWNVTRVFWKEDSLGTYMGVANGTLLEMNLHHDKLLNQTTSLTIQSGDFYEELHFDRNLNIGPNVTVKYDNWGSLEYGSMTDYNGTMFLKITQTNTVLMPAITNVSINNGAVNTTNVEVLLRVEAIGATQMQVMGDITSNTPWIPYFQERIIELDRTTRGDKTVQVRVRNGHRTSEWVLVRIYYDKQTGRGIPGYSVPLQATIIAVLVSGIIAVGLKKKRFAVQR